MREMRIETTAACLCAALLAAACGALAETRVGDELLTNGDFQKLDDRGRPVGWSWPAGAAVRSQKGNTWIELSKYCACVQDVALEANWMKLRVRFRMRITNVVRGDDGWKNARVAMQWQDASGKRVDPWPNVLWAEGTTGWKTCERVFPVPAGARRLNITPALFARPGGKVEYDDVSVTLTRKRMTKPADLPVPRGYEKAWDLADAWRAASATREKLCLNGLWRFLPVYDGKAQAPPKPGQGWGWLKVPGDWPRRTEGAAQDIDLSPYVEDRTDLNELDQAWHRRTIRTPAGWKGRRVAVEFTMLQTHARVFLDGREAGETFFPGGEVDVTKLIRPGAEQSLAILVTARPLAAEATAFMAPDRIIKSKAGVRLRGLTGDVFLLSSPAGERLDDVRITTSTRHSTIRVDAKIGGLAGRPRALRARVLEKGKPVKQFGSGPLDAGGLQGGLACATASWPDAKRWDTHTPQNVYDLVLRLEDADGKCIDESLPIRFGFREFWIDGRDFYLNGKRIHLRALHTWNINKSADLARVETGRLTCTRMKEYGFNFLITGNYDFAPGEVGYMDGLFQAADETGVLASFSLPHVKDFAWKLEQPAQAKRYRELCEWLVRRARSHPSIVMYAMNHNATGYKGDQNPLRMDGVYSPDDPKLGGRPNSNRRQAGVAAQIAREIDPTRPVYHHQSGNLGEVYTVNIYLNWAPKQERSDWLEHWATKGVKPMFFVEWGLPHEASWSSYRGPNFIWTNFEYQCLWDAEYNAEHLGDAAYELTPKRIASREHEESLWATGKPFHYGWLIRHFKNDEDAHTRIKAMFAEDNWRCHRAWGVSAMLPWDQGNLWKQAKGFGGGSRPVKYEPARLKRPGVVADRIAPSDSYLYHPDANQLAPTVLGKAFLRWNRPLCAFIGGGPGPNDFTDKAHNYLPGETVRKQLVILNDTREAVTCSYRWRTERVGQGKPGAFAGHAGKVGKVAVPAGGRLNVPFAVKLPDSANGAYRIMAEFDFGSGRKQTDTFTVHVLPKPAPLALKKRVALFDPKGLTAKLLDKLGVKYEKVAADADVSKYGILVIGREAITIGNKLPDMSAVRKGLYVLIFEQTAETLAHRLGFRVNVHGLRRVFLGAGAGGLVAGNEDLRDWRGSATLVPPYLPIEGVEKDNPRWRWCGFSNTRVWRCGNRGCVASVLIEKPPVGNFTPIVNGGFDLQYAPLLEYVEGRGCVTFCQLDVTGRTESDPAAAIVCGRLLRDLDRSPSHEPRTVLYDGGEKGAALLRQLGVPWKPYEPGAKVPAKESVVVVAPGARHLKELATPAPNLLPFKVCLGLGPEAIARLSRGAVVTKAVPMYGDSMGPGCSWLRQRLSDADRHWRTKLTVDALPRKEGTPPAFLDYRGPSLFLCQVVPWMLDYKAKPYLRTSYRRNVFLVSCLLHILGAPAKTPLLERLSRPGVRNEFVLPAKWVGRPDKDAAGRKAGWWKADFDDAKWKPIRVPGMFDEQYPGLTPAYNGLFWYRLRFRVPADLAAAGLALHLGPADDESWTWLNGKFLGEVTKKTNPKDYWAFARKHAIGPGLLKRDGENVLVVLVNDTFQTGGLTGTPTLAAPGAWLNGYYVQQPVADDDPYRYFRW